MGFVSDIALVNSLFSLTPPGPTPSNQSPLPEDSPFHLHYGQPDLWEPGRGSLPILLVCGLEG